jgi:hypothetical protein
MGPCPLQRPPDWRTSPPANTRGQLSMKPACARSLAEPTGARAARPVAVPRAEERVARAEATGCKSRCVSVELPLAMAVARASGPWRAARRRWTTGGCARGFSPRASRTPSTKRACCASGRKHVRCGDKRWRACTHVLRRSCAGGAACAAGTLDASARSCGDARVFRAHLRRTDCVPASSPARRFRADMRGVRSTQSSRSSCRR